MREPRMSAPTLMVVRHLLAASHPDTSGAAISKATGVSAGTLYPMLARLEAAGWAEGEWERIDPREAGRPRKRFYTLTETGSAGARRHLAALQLPPDDGRPIVRRLIAGAFDAVVGRIRPAVFTGPARA